MGITLFFNVWNKIIVFRVTQHLAPPTNLWRQSRDTDISLSSMWNLMDTWIWTLSTGKCSHHFLIVLHRNWYIQNIFFFLMETSKYFALPFHGWTKYSWPINTIQCMTLNIFSKLPLCCFFRCLKKRLFTFSTISKSYSPV